MDFDTYVVFPDKTILLLISLAFLTDNGNDLFSFLMFRVSKWHHSRQKKKKIIINDKEKKKHYITRIFKGDPTFYTNLKH